MASSMSNAPESPSLHASFKCVARGSLRPSGLLQITLHVADRADLHFFDDARVAMWITVLEGEVDALVDDSEEHLADVHWVAFGTLLTAGGQILGELPGEIRVVGAVGRDHS